MDVEKDDTIEEIQEEYELITEKDPLPRTAKIYYRDKLLDKRTTIRREGIVGGDVLRCVSCPWVRPHLQAPGPSTGRPQESPSNAIASSSRQQANPIASSSRQPNTPLLHSNAIASSSRA